MLFVDFGAAIRLASTIVPLLLFIKIYVHKSTHSITVINGILDSFIRQNQICMRYMRSMTEFFSNIELGVDTFKTINGNEFTVTSVDDKHINISIPGNATVNKLTLSLDEVRKMLESGQKFDKIKDVTTFFEKSYDRQKVIEQNKKNAVRHAYFREYLALQRLAYMFRFDARNGDLKEA